MEPEKHCLHPYGASIPNAGVRVRKQQKAVSNASHSFLLHIEFGWQIGTLQEKALKQQYSRFSHSHREKRRFQAKFLQADAAQTIILAAKKRRAKR